jgi:hypothetical protein
MDFLFQAQGHTYLFHTEVGDHQAEVHVDQVDQPAPPASLEPEDTEA